MGVSVFGRCKQQIREPVGNDAIDLLRHGTVKGPKPSLDMADGYQQLGTNQGSRDGGIHVTIDEDHVWFVFEYNRFKTPHDLGCLLRVTTRSHSEVGIRFRNFQLSKEYVRHIPVVMLASMNERLPDATSLNGPQHGRCLHEVRSSSYHVKNVLHFMVAAIQPLAFLSSMATSHRMSALCGLRQAFCFLRESQKRRAVDFIRKIG